MKAIYPGRFQPFLLKHAEIAKKIVRERGDELLVGIADWKGERTKANFLFGPESLLIAQLTLEEIGLSQARAILVELWPDSTLGKDLGKIVEEHQIDYLYSGSDKTLAAARTLNRLANRVIDLGDDDESPPRAREVRLGIEEGNNEWTRFVAVGVVEILQRPEFAERLRDLEEGDKRPWKLSGNGSHRK